MTDTEKAAMERRIDELCAENERLRKRLKESDDGRMRQADNLIDKYHKIAHLQTENAKLCEFAGQVLYFTTMTDGCGDNCPYSSSDCSHECHLRKQGRELGIEVD